MAETLDVFWRTSIWCEAAEIDGDTIEEALGVLKPGADLESLKG